MKPLHKVLASVLLLMPCVAAHAQKSTCQPVTLKCNYWVDPLGIDDQHPDLSWTVVVSAERRSMRQTAYQILVASSAAQLAKSQGNLWNSGKVLSDQSLQISYAGAPLSSNQHLWWKVRVWDEKGIASKWSHTAQWTMGILHQNEWTAQWITAKGAEKYAPVIEPRKTDFDHRSRQKWRAKMPLPDDPNFSSMLVRKEFSAHQQPVRCVIHICGLGEYELRINGKKVGDQLLGPAWSSYDKTALYNTYDVTPLIRKGNNAIGIILSNGVYNIQPDSIRYVKMLNTYGPLKVIAQLRLEYPNGTVKTIATDDSWQVSPGPVTFMNYYGGEDYDARLEPMGWSNPNFGQATQWQKAIFTTNPAELKGLSCSAPPVKAIESLKPIKVTQISENTKVYDLGQNTALMPQITVSGKRGARLRIIPAELVKANGEVDRTSATQDGVRPAWWQYTIGTDGTASWFPQFFYQGGRYLQVEVFPAPGDKWLPELKELKGVVVHSSAEPIGQFACSNQLFNQIYQLVRWAQRSNMMTVLTDCPQREKMPWLEQYHLNGPSLRYNYDLTTLFRKAMNDMADAQLENGFVPNIAPEYFHAGADWKHNGLRNSPEWGSSFIIVPWQQYLFSGDVSLMRRYYDKMKRYLAFLDSSSKGHMLTTGLGDWYDIGPKPAWGSQLTPVAFTATAIYFYDYEIMAKIARIIGRQEDALKFEQEQQAIKEAFNNAFYIKDKGIYATGSNTTCAMPIFLNLVDSMNRARLMQTLVDSIRNKSNSFTSGEVGYRFLLRSLADNGFSNVVYDMNNQTERPGYGYQIAHGATSLTEKWDAGVGSFGSQNHFMSGQINEWFFHDLIGIRENEDGPGFKKIIIKPAVVGDLTWVKGSYQSVNGLISVGWKRVSDATAYDIAIPANTTAIVIIPANTTDQITEGSRPVQQNVNGITGVKIDHGNAILNIGSGIYHFTVKEKK